MVFKQIANCPCPMCSKFIPTVKPSQNFNADEDASAIKSAMKGFGCDNEEITSIIAARSANQRDEIADAYKNLYGEDLLDDLKSELGGNFERLVIALFHPWPQFAARAIKKACKGAGTNEQALIDILCTANNCQIKAIKEAYEEMYDDPLEERIEEELSGDFKCLMIALIQGARHEDESVDVEKAAGDASALHEAGELKYGTDESVFRAVLVSNSYGQLNEVSSEYEKLAGKSLQEAVDEELSGGFRDAATAILSCAKDAVKYWSRRLMECMEGLGTSDKALINIIVARSEIDLGNIKKEFQLMYETSLEEQIESECSGDYKNLLLAIVKD